MPVLLRIDSSVNSTDSRTRCLTQSFVDSWCARGEEFTLLSRDVHEEPLPHLYERAQHWPEHLRSGATLALEVAELQESLLSELLAADVLLLGAPMYNYGIPSTLKAWIDLVHVPGTTAPFDSPAQPLKGKSAVIVTAQGGATEEPVSEFVTAPLRHLLGSSFGMDVHVVSTSRTLAGMVPALDAAQAAEELAHATVRARELGRSLCGSAA